MKRKGIVQLFLFLTPLLLLTNCGLQEKNDPSVTTDGPSNEPAKVAAGNDPYVYTGDPLKVAVIGLTHDHVHQILGRKKYGDITIVGIVEPNQVLAERYSTRYGFSMDMVYGSMEALYEQVQPEAAMAFNNIHDHLAVVSFFAPKGVHVMVEKPLAVSVEHAKKMDALAKKHKIQLMTNYETTWYGSNEKAYELVHSEGKIGDIRRFVFNTGHPGPIEIGCSTEFTDWLTDPHYNGGGALTDFGCYGANLASWIMKGEHPETVTCITRQIKPAIYSQVDDDATFMITYPKAQLLIQASWNWSHNRKDMAIYGEHGYVFCKNGEDMTLLESEKEGPKTLKASPLEPGLHDPFAYFTKVVKKGMSMDSFSPSSLDNNLLVVKILEAARHSSKTGKTVIWDEFYAND